ncbi:MAG: VWA domain-containing protein [Actinobacteria bacterium]|jgi:Ca-activated chloride channel family protein|nr:VWA domain-containing protein [Actinomycetota bacterium]
MTTDFLNPGRLWLLVVVLALAILYVVVLRWRRAATVRFTQLSLLDKVAPSRPHWRRHVVAGIQLLGLTAAVIAIARPVEHSTELTTSEGRILVLFDVSLSMDADDVDPNRFEAARDAARDFVDAVDPGVEVGLISFSGEVNADVNPTLDRGAMERGIDQLELAESTAIGDALAAGTRLLVNSADQDADPDIAPGVIVLLSDGETTVGRLTSDGAQEAADAGVPVFTIAFGTDSGSITDPISGEVVPVPVRPADLELVADTTGGVAFEAKTGGELADAYDEIADSLGETLGEEIQIVTELTWRWALAAFLLLSVAWALSLWWLRGMV